MWEASEVSLVRPHYQWVHSGEEQGARRESITMVTGGTSPWCCSVVAKHTLVLKSAILALFDSKKRKEKEEEEGGKEEEEKEVISRQKFSDWSEQVVSRSLCVQCVNSRTRPISS